MADPGASKYGQYYWCVLLLAGEEITVHADLAKITDNGDLLLLRTSRWLEDDTYEQNALDPPHVNLAVAAGRWVTFYAASVWDGGPVAVEHWKEPAPRAKSATS
jgi:hypothetical protein